MQISLDRETPTLRQAPFRLLTAALALSIAYYLAGKLGLTLAFVNSSVTAVWPPTGIALAALLLFGFGVWPGILVGAFLVNLTTAGSVWTSLGIAAGNTLEAVAAAFLVNRFAEGRRALDRPQNVFRFALFAGALSPALCATIGVTALSLGGFASVPHFGSIWLTWWLGDAAGALVVAPLFLLWAASPRPRWSKGKAVEGAVLLAVLVFTGRFVFGGALAGALSRRPLEFLCLPPLLWVAFRFRQRESALAMVLLSALAVTGTLAGHGPFAGRSPNESLLLLTVFLAVVSVTTLALASEVEARKRADEARRRLAAIVESSWDAIIGKTLDGVITSWNQGAESIYGYESSEAVGRSIRMLLPSDCADDLDAILEKLRRGETIARYETERIRKDGSRIFVSLTVSPIRDLNGRVVGASTIARDISDRKRAQEQLFHSAYYDALTGLPNRALFLERLTEAIGWGMRRDDQSFALLFLDLDRFKFVNDTFGHLIGDAMLVEVGKRLQTCIRPGDTAARLGGDEFTLLVTKISSGADATRVAERVQAVLSRPFLLQERELFTSASIGIALAGPVYSSAEEMLRDADTALRLAKRRGRARHEVFDTSLPSPY